MQKLIATVFNYSLDGLLADQGTAFWDFCFSLPENNQPGAARQLDFLRGASAHVFGRSAYGGTSVAMMTNTGHPFSPILNAAPKVVFSRTMNSAAWNNTVVASGETTEEVDRLRQGGDGYIIVWGGVRLWRSLMQRDLLDEIQFSVFPYIAGEGTRLFNGVPKSYALELVSSSASENGIVTLRYQRRR